MNREELMKILPHRTPMLLVDEAQMIDGVSIGRYTVRGYEWFLQGHFPDMPIVPGVILCEMMAQSACLLFQNHGGKGITPYFTGLDKVRFKNSVFPGDTIEFHCQITAKKKAFYFARGKGYVNGKLCISGEFSFLLVTEANNPS